MVMKYMRAQTEKIGEVVGCNAVRNAGPERTNNTLKRMILLIDWNMTRKRIPYPSLRVKQEEERRDQKESEEYLHVVR
jgi:hypothetical protein